MLADLDEAERGASAQITPRGRLRVNANMPFGHHFMLPLAPEFLQRYPDVTLDIGVESMTASAAPWRA